MRAHNLSYMFALAPRINTYSADDDDYDDDASSVLSWGSNDWGSWCDIDGINRAKHQVPHNPSALTPMNPPYPSSTTVPAVDNSSSDVDESSAHSCSSDDISVCQ